MVQFVNDAYTDINAGIEYLLDGTLALGSAAYNQVVDFVGNTWSDVTNFAAGAWGTASDWMTDPVDNIISWAGDAWDGVVDWADSSWDTAENWFSNASSWASGVWDSAGGAVSQIQNAAGDWWNEASGFVGDTLNGAGNFLSDQGAALSDWWNDTAPDWGELTGQGKELFQGIAKNIGTAASGFADDLGAMLPDSLGLMTLNPALALITNPIESAQTATNLYNTFKAVAENPDILWDAVGTPDEWWDASTDWVSDAWNDTTKTLGDAWNSSTEALGNAWGAVVNTREKTGQWLDENKTYRSFSDWGHGLLDAGGLVPAFGVIPDAINAVWYGAEGIGGKEGAWIDTAFSAGAAIPILGYGATGGKYINKAGKIVDKASDAGKVADKLKDGSKAADKLKDGAKAIDEGSDAAKALPGSDTINTPSVKKGPYPDATPSNLTEQLLLQDAKAGAGKVIQGGQAKPLGDAPRLVDNYGGQTGDWVKMRGDQTKIVDGKHVEVHWYRNTKTGQNVEFKFKYQ
jgi:hypothetical protein